MPRRSSGEKMENQERSGWNGFIQNCKPDFNNDVDKKYYRKSLCFRYCMKMWIELERNILFTSNISSHISSQFPHFTLSLGRDKTCLRKTPDSANFQRSQSVQIQVHRERWEKYNLYPVIPPPLILCSLSLLSLFSAKWVSHQILFHIHYVPCQIPLYLFQYLSKF